MAQFTVVQNDLLEEYCSQRWCFCFKPSDRPGQRCWICCNHLQAAFYYGTSTAKLKKAHKPTCRPWRPEGTQKGCSLWPWVWWWQRADWQAGCWWWWWLPACSRWTPGPPGGAAPRPAAPAFLPHCSPCSGGCLWWSWMHGTAHTQWDITGIYHCTAHTQWDITGIYHCTAHTQWDITGIYHCTAHTQWDTGQYHCTAHTQWDSGQYHCTAHTQWDTGLYHCTAHTQWDITGIYHCTAHTQWDTGLYHCTAHTQWDTGLYHCTAHTQWDTGLYHCTAHTQWDTGLYHCTAHTQWDTGLYHCTAHTQWDTGLYHCTAHTQWDTGLYYCTAYTMRHDRYVSLYSSHTMRHDRPIVVIQVCCVSLCVQYTVQWHLITLHKHISTVCHFAYMPDCWNNQNLHLCFCSLQVGLLQLSGCPFYLLSGLQKVQNSTGPSQNRLQTVNSLSQLPDSSLAYFSDLTVYTPSRQFCSSADTQILRIPRVKTKTSGLCCFSHCAPKQWNLLPSKIHPAHIKGCFPWKQTVLFMMWTFFACCQKVLMVVGDRPRWLTRLAGSLM